MVGFHSKKILGVAKRAVLLGALLHFNDIKTPSSIVSSVVISFTKARPGRAFVCVTGVLANLELESKISNLLLPLKQMGVSVDISLTLQSDEDPLFPSRCELARGANSSAKSWDRNSSFFHSSEEISIFMKSQSHFNFSISVGSPLTNPPINIEYFRALALQESDYGGGIIQRERLEAILSRAVNDVRLLHSYRQCWEDAVARTEKANSVTPGHNYDFFVRIGADSILSESIIQTSNSVLWTLSQNQRTVVSVPCKSMCGHNTNQVQVDFVSPFAAPNYFLLPFARLYEAEIFRDWNISSLSAYLRFVYDTANITMFTTKLASLEQLPKLMPSLSKKPSQSGSFANLYPMSYHSFINASHGDMIHNYVPTSLLDGNTSKNVLVCITGQLGRLELANKINTLIKPLQDAGFEVDIAFSLSSGKTEFNKKPMKPVELFKNGKQVMDYLISHNLSVISSNATFVPNWNMPANPEYVLNKGQFRNKRKTAENMATVDHFLYKQVVANHIMTESYTRCWRDVKRVKGESKYNLYIRLRDDVGFLEPLKHDIFEPMEPQTMVVSGCRTNGGINDRLAIVSPEVAECYFNLPFAKLYDGSRLDAAMSNTESFFKRIYWRENCIPSPKTRKDLRPVKMLGGNFLRNDVNHPLC